MVPCCQCPVLSVAVVVAELGVLPRGSAEPCSLQGRVMTLARGVLSVALANSMGQAAGVIAAMVAVMPVGCGLVALGHREARGLLADAIPPALGQTPTQVMVTHG